MRWALFLMLVLAACGGTETDNPLDPDWPGAHGGDDYNGDGDGDGDRPPHASTGGLADPAAAGSPCVPPDFDGRPRELPLADLSGLDLLATDNDGHLAWVDASDPGAPEVKAQLTLPGRPRQLVAGPGPTATVVMVGFAPRSLDEAPDPRELEPLTQLVRVEADGDALRQVAAITLEGNFWRMTTKGEGADTVHWIMAARPRNALPYCDINPRGCGGSSGEALLLTGYRFENSDFQKVQAVELPMTYRAWGDEHGYATNTGAGTVHYVRFEADDRLSAPASLDVFEGPNSATSIDLQRDQLRMFLPSLSGGDSRLEVYDLAQAPASLLSKTPLPEGRSGVSFSNGGVYPRAHFRGNDVFIEGEPGFHVDLRNPAEPRFTPIPTQLLGVWPVAHPAAEAGEELLATLEADPDHALALSLWSRFGTGVEALDRVALPSRTDGSYTAHGSRPAQVGNTLWIVAPGPQRERYLHGIRIEEDRTLTLIGGEPAGRHSDQLLATADGLLGVGHDRIVVHQPGGGVNAGLVPLNPEGQVWHTAVGRDFIARTHQTANDERPFGGELRVSRGDTVETLDLPYRPDVLRAVGDRVLAFNVAPRSECEQAGRDDCDAYVPHVRVFNAAAPLTLVAEVPLPASPFTGATDGYTDFGWSLEDGRPRLELPDGRLLLLARASAHCEQPQECEALGIAYVPIEEASVNTATCVEVGPNGEPGNCPPPATVYGTLRELRLYALDAQTTPPAFTLLGHSALADHNSSFGPTRVSAGAVLVTRAERIPVSPPYSGARPRRIMLDLFELNPDGGASPRDPINVPGYPLAVTPELDRLVSAERTDRGLTLYRSSLDGSVARILETQVLPNTTFDSALTDGSRTHLVAHAGRGCNALTELYTLNPSQALPVEAPLSLMGDGVRIEDQRANRLLLVGRGSWVALVDVAQPDAPTLERFLVLPWPVHHANLTADGALDPRLAVRAAP